MKSAQHQPEADFTAAEKYWHLEKLYIDLAAVKGRGLTPLEKKFLQALLCGYSPAEIAAQVYQSRSSSAVRVSLSNGLYKYLQELFIRQTGKAEKIKNWSCVTNLLEKAGYKKEYARRPQASASSPVETSIFTNLVPVTDNYQDWEERIDVRVFSGRDEELAQLKQWIVKERCRAIALLGMGGVGKTALAVKLVEQIQGEFECIIWRSLGGAPRFEDILADLIQSLSQGCEVDLPAREATISHLMVLLRSRRCLLVFNQFESVLSSGGYAGFYRDRYQGYGELLRRLAEECHPSCCILTSREKPQEIAVLEGGLSVRSLCISGLKTTDAQKLLQIYDLVGSEKEQRLLVNLYAKNPLAIKNAALTIKNIFNRNIAEFLATRIIIFKEIRELLDQQFNRLSDLEQGVMYALAVNQRLGELQEARKELSLRICPPDQLEALESLQRRSLIRPNSFRFRQQSLLKAYILEKLVEQVETPMKNKDVARILKHILWETLLKDEKLKSAVA